MLRRTRRLAAALLLFFPFVTNLDATTRTAVPYVTPQMMELIQAHRRVLERMNALSKDGRPSPLDEPGMPPLLTEGWKLAGEWATVWLDLHPNASAKQLDRLFVDLTPPPPHPKYYDEKLPDVYAMEGSATRIAPEVYVVTAVYGTELIGTNTGTFWVISRDPSGHFQPLWNIKPLAEQHYASKDEIGLWAFLGACAYHCGPLIIDKILPLPPTGKGMPRFAVNAWQATNGGTIEAQFSVWEWNGKEAAAELIESYNYAADYGGIRAKGNLVSITTKEPTDTFFSCGMCPEPHGTWTLLLTPGGTRDLGHRFRTPEIQWADKLLTTIAASGDASTMASSEVIAEIRGAIDKERAKYPPSKDETEEEKESVYFGMFDKCKILGRGRKGSFFLAMDEAEFRFSYEMHGSQPFFIAVTFSER